LNGRKVENGDFTLMVVQSFRSQFVGGMIRPSLVQEPQTILKHSSQQHSTAHRAYLIVVIESSSIFVRNFSMLELYHVTYM